MFGKKNVGFSQKYFKGLQRKTEANAYDHYMAFVVIEGQHVKKYIVDFWDKRHINEIAYEWCDKYAKINFYDSHTPHRFRKKTISIPPGFGVHIWGLSETVIHSIQNLVKCGISPLVSLKHHFKTYLRQYRHLTVEDYLSPGPGNDKPFVFMIGTLWPHQNCIERTNRLRRDFIEICQSAGLNFEGGFYASKDHLYYEEFKDHIFTRRYPIQEYLIKMKKSIFVFNTPAVHECHGWKLGQSLAMGKAIISTPLSNTLPEGLVHGENIHIVKDSEELKDAIALLSADMNYRDKLEAGAREYYLRLGSPRSVIERLTGRVAATASKSNFLREKLA